MNYGQKKNECKGLCCMIGTGTWLLLWEQRTYKWLGFFWFCGALFCCVFVCLGFCWVLFLFVCCSVALFSGNRLRQGCLSSLFLVVVIFSSKKMSTNCVFVLSCLSGRVVQWKPFWANQAHLKIKIRNLLGGGFWFWTFLVLTQEIFSSVILPFLFALSWCVLALTLQTQTTTLPSSWTWTIFFALGLEADM